MEEKYIKKNTIFQTITGSKLYGTDIPESDIDTKGICIIDRKHYVGFLGNFEQWQAPETDTEIYDIRKAFDLIAGCNPNMFDLVFAPREFWIKTTSYWELIYSHRYEFLSKKVRFTYSGYAYQQLNRILSHRKWLMNPPDHQPTREEFGFKKCPVSKDLIRAVLSLPSHILVDNIKEDIIKEQKYQEALKNWQSYKDWKIKRNPVRAALEARIGYDTKHAAHLIRLLRTGKEILTKGEVFVSRRGIDEDELKAIRNCEWSFDKVIGEAKAISAELDSLYESSTLNRSPDMNKLNDLCIEVTEQYWEENK